MNEPPYLEAVVRMTVFDHAPAHVKALALEEGDADDGALLRWWASLSDMHRIDILAAADRRSTEAASVEGNEGMTLAMAEPERPHILEAFFHVFR